MPNSSETRPTQTETGGQINKTFLAGVRKAYKLAIPALAGLLFACTGQEVQNHQINIDKASPETAAALPETLSSYDKLLIKLAEGELETIIVNGGEGWYSALLRLGLTNLEIGSKLVDNVKRATVSQEAGKLSLRRVFVDEENSYLSYDKTTTLGAALQNSNRPLRPGEILTLLPSPTSEIEVADYDQEMETAEPELESESEIASPTEPDQP